MTAAGPKDDLVGTVAMQAYIASVAVTEMNLAFRRSFLMFLYGCNIHMTSTSSSSSSSLVEGVIKCLRIPYFDRAVMEYIYYKV